MHALGRLIHDCRKKDPALTYERIAKRAGVTTSTVGGWANPKAEKLDKLPLPGSIIGLAEALHLPAVQVLLASAEAVGIDVTSAVNSGFASRLPSNIDELPQELQDQHLRLLWAEVRLYGQTKT